MYSADRYPTAVPGHWLAAAAVGDTHLIPRDSQVPEHGLMFLCERCFPGPSEDLDMHDAATPDQRDGSGRDAFVERGMPRFERGGFGRTG